MVALCRVQDQVNYYLLNTTTIAAAAATAANTTYATIWNVSKGRVGGPGKRELGARHWTKLNTE